jgi:hypothetical protein
MLRRQKGFVLEQSTIFSDSVEMTLSGDAIPKPDSKNENMPAHMLSAACWLGERGNADVTPSWLPCPL